MTIRATPLRNNFNGGEVSPRIDMRGDLDKYNSGCITLEGFIPLIEGGATRVPGTAFIAETKNSSKRSRLLPFRFSTIQSYIIELGDGYARFYKDMTQIESGGVPVEVVMPYTEAKIAAVKITQSADVLYMFHAEYVSRKLIRSSHTVWALSSITFSPPPTRELGHKPVATLTPAATTGTSVVFTASASSFLTGDDGRIIQSGASRASITSVISGTQVACEILEAFPSTDPIASQSWQILYTPIGEVTPSATKKGQICTLDSTGSGGGYTDLIVSPDDNWTLSATGTTEYYLKNTAPGYSATSPDSVYIDGLEATAGVLGSLGILQWAFGDNDTLGYSTVYVRLDDGTDPDANIPNSFVQRFDGGSIELFRSVDVGKYVFVSGGFLKLTQVVSAAQAKGEILQDLSSTAPTDVWSLEEPLWSAANGYPSVGQFFEQRLCVGGSTNFPQTFNLSMSGDYENFSRDPGADDAAIEYTIVSNQSEAINWFAGADYLMIGTIAGIWKFGATTTTEAFSQTNVSSKKQGENATRSMAALPVTNAVLWVGFSARTLNRLAFSLEADRFVSTDLTRVASHIAIGDSAATSGLSEVAFQQSPFPIVWSIRGDGTLLGMTYSSPENVYGWFRVVTDGEFESVAVISDGDAEDQVWVIVKRTINGAVKRLVECFKPIEFFSVLSDAFFVHAGVTFDGGDAVTITGITQANPPVVSAVNSFTNGDKVRIRDVEGMTQVNQGALAAYTVANRAAGSFELSGIDATGWSPYSGGGTAQVVKKAFTTGLTHLEGKEVDILTDGAVHPRRTVTGGAITLNWYGNVVHIGLPNTAILEPTKPAFDMGGGSSRGKKQRIHKAQISFYETVGGKIGPDVDNLKPIKFGTGGAPTLFTGEKEQPFEGSWGSDAPLVIVQDLPLPMTIRSISYLLSVNNEE